MLRSKYSCRLGGRYDFSFDGHDRLTAADYTAGEGAAADEDFSTAYGYNDAGAPVTLWRKGVISMEEDFDGEPIETFGEMDYLDYAWNGAQLVYVDAQPLGWDFYGRTGFAGSTSGDGADFAWDAAGQMTADSSRGITDIEYNWAGQPVRVVFNNKQEIQYGYTCDGVLETMKAYRVVGGRLYPRPKSTRTYAGDFVFENDTLSMINFPGGYFDSKGRPCYRHTNWQGNVTMVTDHNGQLTQHTGYYPYGEPWREPAGQPYLFGAKERLRDNALNEYDFSARRYLSSLAIWTTPDPKASEEPSINPLVYCSVNPIKFIDPSGNKGELVVTNNSITLRGKMYVHEVARSSAEHGANMINNYSNTIEFEAKRKDSDEFITIPLKFEVTVETLGEQENLEEVMKNDKIGNSFELVPDTEMEASTNGEFSNLGKIRVKESRSTTETSTHEQLHALGLDHSDDGIMTSSSNSPKRSEKLYKESVFRDVKRLINDPKNLEYILIKVANNLIFDLETLKLKTQ